MGHLDACLIAKILQDESDHFEIHQNLINKPGLSSHLQLSMSLWDEKHYKS